MLVDVSSLDTSTTLLGERMGACACSGSSSEACTAVVAALWTEVGVVSSLRLPHGDPSP